MYKVIVRFVDLQDDNHNYHVGDTFPREGKKVSEARINELKGTNNKRGKSLIEEVVVAKPAPAPVPMNKPEEEVKSEVHEETAPAVTEEVKEDETPKKKRVSRKKTK